MSLWSAIGCKCWLEYLKLLSWSARLEGCMSTVSHIGNVSSHFRRAHVDWLQIEVTCCLLHHILRLTIRTVSFIRSSRCVILIWTTLLCGRDWGKVKVILSSSPLEESDELWVLVITDGFEVCQTVLLTINLVLMSDHLCDFVVVDKCSSSNSSFVWASWVVTAIYFLSLSSRSFLLFLQLVALSIFVADLEDLTNALRNATI